MQRLSISSTIFTLSSSVTSCSSSSWSPRTCFPMAEKRSFSSFWARDERRYSLVRLACSAIIFSYRNWWSELCTAEKVFEERTTLSRGLFKNNSINVLFVVWFTSVSQSRYDAQHASLVRTVPPFGWTCLHLAADPHFVSARFPKNGTARLIVAKYLQHFSKRPNDKWWKGWDSNPRGFPLRSYV